MSKKHGGNKKIPRVMYIYCEGEKTEPLYLEAYISERSKRTLSVFKIPKTRKNTPEQLVDEAIKKKIHHLPLKVTSFRLFMIKSI